MRAGLTVAALKQVDRDNRNQEDDLVTVASRKGKRVN
jgi:hypothetical protein